MPPRASTQASQANKKRGRAAVRDSDEEDFSDDASGGEKASASKAKKGKASAKKAATKGKGKQREVNSDEGDSEAEAAGSKKKGALSLDDRKSLAQDLTRYALFCECTRKALRRDDVVKILLKDRARHFPDLILRAQANLKSVLGMELVQLRAKEGAKNPVKAYVLRSTLPQDLIAASISELHDTLTPEEQDREESAKGVWRTVRDLESEDTGSLRDCRTEEVGSYGILGVILGLILVNGKALSDDQLVSYLRRISLSQETPIPTSIAAAHPNMTVQQYLALLIRQGYLEKTQLASNKSGQTTSKNGGEIGMQWKWGARSEVEIGEAGIANFLLKIHSTEFNREVSDDEGEEEVEGVPRRPTTAEAKKAKAIKTLNEITRASGAKELAKPTDQEGIRAQ